MSVTWTRDGGVVELVLDEAPLNEIGLPMLEALERFVADLDPERDRAVVIASRRPGFCAGADLRQLYHELAATDPAEREPRLRDFIDRIHRVFDTLDMLPMTTVAAVHGICFGGGFELALTCDLIVADRSARFCFPELRLGLVPGFGGIPRLSRDCGNAVVRDLLMTGRSLNAKKAVACGLASQMVAPGEALGVARLVAQQAAKFDPEARATCKQFMKPLPRAALDAEKAHFLRLAQRPVVMDALRRFVESTDVRPYLP